MGNKKISIVTPCYNEEGNVGELWALVKMEFEKLGNYDYEHIFIDNHSKDQTVTKLREIAAADKRVKVILNTRNFGQVRSPYHGLLQADGDAVILLVADLQDPPALIQEFIKKWEEGFKIVVGIKETSEESKLMFLVRKAYYGFIFKLADSEIKLLKNFTGFGLYDKSVMEIIKTINDPYPYFRGLVSEIGFDIAEIKYRQPQRKRGITSNNFYRLYDYAMLGITSHTKVPLRIATIGGFLFSIISFLIAIAYFVYKLIYWDRFEAGLAPIIIGVFFIFSVLLLFMGLLGEYILAIHTKVMNRPPVVEKERINF